jgi:hypothetical protein
MNTQNQLESAKDDDFDFFKKPKISSSQSVDTESPLQISNSKQRTHKNEIKFKLIYFVFAFIISAGIILFDGEPKNNKPVYVTPNGGWVVSQPLVLNPVHIQEESNFTTSKDTINNIDYSKLSKEDAARVKQALEQFKDVQKTLIETSKPVGKPQ